MGQLHFQLAELPSVLDVATTGHWFDPFKLWSDATGVAVALAMIASRVCNSSVRFRCAMLDQRQITVPLRRVF